MGRTVVTGWLQLEPFDHVRDSIGAAVVGAVVSPDFREAEAAKDGNQRFSEPPSETYTEYTR